MNINTEPLTREQISELRKAERVSFSHSPSGAIIRAIRRQSAEREKETSIPVDSEVSGVRDIEDIREFRKKCTCHYLLWSNCGFHARQWSTIASILKAGDHIILHWGRDYDSSENTRKVDLHADRLELQIVRNDRRKYSFLIHIQVCPNNTARMIRNGLFNMG
jgi:hypothetical protein